MTLSSLFGPSSALVSESGQSARTTMKSARFGERVDSIARYKMPLLPGESGPKSGGDWVPGGIQSATNLAGALVDPMALSIWTRERAQIGYATEPSLAENMIIEINKARARGVDLATLKDEEGKSVALREFLKKADESARKAGGALESARQGTNRHDVWEERALTGALTGTTAINAQIRALEELLAKNGLVRVKGLQERTVRNTALRAAGRFDDVLMSERTGQLYMADLKTKRRAFFSWLEVWIQKAVYATADYMLSEDGQTYEPGPLHHVSQEVGVVLHMPADGSPPVLHRADIQQGLEWAHLARKVCDVRSAAASVGSMQASVWNEGL